MAPDVAMKTERPDTFALKGLKRELEDVADNVTTKRQRHAHLDIEGPYNDAESHSSVESFAGTSEEAGSASTPATLASQGKNWRPYVYNCPRDDCDRVFNRPCRLAEHMRSHTDERPYKCSYPDCDKSFRRDTHLSRHIKSTHTDERPHPCTWPGCDKRFANATRMRRHYDTHEQKEQFRCTDFPPCNETFRKHKTLQSHIASAHLDRKPWPCTFIDQETGIQCIRAYNTEGKLRSHEAKAHSGELRFVCSLCATEHVEEQDELTYCFATQAALTEHIRQQHPPTCDECEIVFDTQGALASHIDRVHMEQSTKALFHCDEPGCGKSFAKRNNLKEHVRIVHKGEKRFVCGHTDVSGSSKFEEEVAGQVVLHEWNGEGCNRAFGTKATLEEHIRTQHLGLEGSVRVRKRKQLLSEGRDPDAVAKLGRSAGGVSGRGSRTKKVEQGRQPSTLTTTADLPVGKFYFGGLDEDPFAAMEGEMDIDIDDGGSAPVCLGLDAFPGVPVSDAYEPAGDDAHSFPIDPVLQYLAFES